MTGADKFTFTLWGIDFNYLAMLNEFLNGFLPGVGFVMAFILAYLMALWLSRKPKPKRRKIRVKLLTYKEAGHD